MLDFVMLTENILIIYNPNSGRGRAERLANRLKAKLGGEAFCSNSIEVVYEFCKQNSQNPKGYTLAIIIGGDGTLSPWVDAMIRHNFRVPIYAFGRGTANDFSAFLRTARSIRKTCKAIRRAKIQQVDTLLINDTQFCINVACGGAFTNGVTSYSKKGKRRFGKLAYMFKAMCQAFKLRAQQVRFTVDDQEIIADTFLFLVLNSPNAGSIRKISRVTKPWDGKLELVVIKRCGFFGKVSLLISGMFKRLWANSNVIVASGTKFSIEIMGEANKNFTLTDIDGNKGGPYPMSVKLGDEKIPFVVY